MRKYQEGFTGWLSAKRRTRSLLLAACRIESVDSFVAVKTEIIEIECHRVRRELVDWMEGDLTPDWRAQIDYHLDNCHHCTAVYDGAKNVVRLLGDANAIELPPGFSQRLYERLFQSK